MQKSTLVALSIALVGLVLRLSLVGFPIGSHVDELIIGKITQRAVEQGSLTANWAGFESEWWSRPTYQFSPYTLLQSVIAWTAHWLTEWPTNLDGHIMLARMCSCIWGAATVFLVFVLGRICFKEAAALFGEATLAVCFLAVQDSIYARVDAFLGCLVLASLTLLMVAAKEPERVGWFVAACACAGVTVATKYNAALILLLIPAVVLHWVQRGAMPGHRAMLLGLAGLGIAVVGFVLATPEILWRPGPLFSGIRFELDHYTRGQIPHMAHGWRDNNLFYWFNYLGWIGLGWLPLAFALLFIGRMRGWERVVLGTYLVTALLLVFGTRIRFERNLEICIGVMALVAGASAWDVWSRRKWPQVVLLAAVILWLAQPVITIYRFNQTVNFPKVWVAQLNASLKAVPTAHVQLTQPYNAEALGENKQVILWDYGDPLSAENLARYNKLLRAEPRFVLESPWSRHCYPFSTVDLYHGPRRILVFER
jgi:4-amino-4-deoxy-L-arabinose transferase-like glycosyltransferase